MVLDGLKPGDLRVDGPDVRPEIPKHAISGLIKLLLGAFCLFGCEVCVAGSEGVLGGDEEAAQYVLRA